MNCEPCPKRCFTKFPNCFQLLPGKNSKTNPGNVQDLHALAQRIMPKFFDGLELDYVHRLANNKTITSNWVLSHIRPSGFRFGGIYSHRITEDLLSTPIVQADINPSTLASNVSFIYYPFNSLRFELDLQRPVEDVPLQTHALMEIIRPSLTLTANFYNVCSQSGRTTFSVMQSISERWALGAELLCEWTDPNSLSADTALAVRYSLYNYSVAATASRQGVDISFWQRLHERVQMASLFAWHRKTEKTIATVCYQWNFDDSIVRGMIDSDMSVGFMYFRSLQHIPCGMGVSLLISLPTNRFIFGLKFNLDPSGHRRGE